MEEKYRLLLPTYSYRVSMFKGTIASCMVKLGEYVISVGFSIFPFPLQKNSKKEPLFAFFDFHINWTFLVHVHSLQAVFILLKSSSKFEDATIILKPS